MRINPDEVHIRRDKKHKDCEWYWDEEFECTNWRDFKDGECYAWVECFKPKKKR